MITFHFIKYYSKTVSGNTLVTWFTVHWSSDSTATTTTATADAAAAASPPPPSTPLPLPPPPQPLLLTIMLFMILIYFIFVLLFSSPPTFKIHNFLIQCLSSFRMSVNINTVSHNSVDHWTFLKRLNVVCKVRTELQDSKVTLCIGSLENPICVSLLALSF